MAQTRIFVRGTERVVSGQNGLLRSWLLGAGSPLVVPIVCRKIEQLSIRIVGLLTKG